ncbi:Xaa-Pro dipeptidase [Glutamicibacter halophytocola]|uniref:YigZ family protein n=2 Tax=Glutamicibacter halophytocola TaxID=1933880 RepID=A0ABX5Y609_9MICC|nr:MULTISPECIES: YigZ family protein [Glutamicibacter]ALG29285.1 Xaa-Pro dipeptidase [Glutamicibacter halophytocola]MBF6673398.1 YigZ family protein [Glutamicibacter sp. FBE19]QDY65544.1 YigZ family protein [Glutamicibacter halophytocola]
MNTNESAATSYTTLRGDSVHELEIKRSRFITYLYRVETEAEARNRIAGLRKTHFDARHHCTAFILGPDRMTQRSNDDGEPSGTAGIPMLDALAKRDLPDQSHLSDTLAVVVRYFGGIKLGAGGLVRAYSEAVSSGLDHASLLRRQRLRIFTLPASHALAARYENELRAAGYQIEPTHWEADAALVHIGIPDTPEAAEELRVHVAALTAGAGELATATTRWVDLI